jgi:hypothetical protein
VKEKRASGKMSGVLMGRTRKSCIGGSANKEM